MSMDQKYGDDMTWTRFMDMHSGGGQKLKWAYIYIEAPESEARSVFYSRFDRNPEYITCTCCGEDYSVGEDKTLKEITAFERHCRWDDKTKTYVEEPDPRYILNKHIPLNKYLKQKNVLFIYAKDIKSKERKVKVPKGSWQWVEE